MENNCDPEEYYMNSIEYITAKILCQFSEEEKKHMKCILTVTFLTGILSYFLLMVDGYVCPDGLIEGQYYYFSEDWALANGRWATRYLNLLIGHNVVMPSIVVLLYCLFLSISTFLITKIFHINKTIHLVLISAFMIASPVVIGQLTYTYMALCYVVAFLGSVSYCFLVRKKGKICWLSGILLLAISLGLYQSYLGAAALLILLITIYDLLQGKSIKEAGIQLFQYGITGALACVLDVIEFKAEIRLRHTFESDRSAAFDVKLIFTSLKESIRNAYVRFFDYFKDPMLDRNHFYTALGICAFLLLFFLLIRLCRKQEYAKAGIVLLCIISIPAAANVIGIFIPYNDIVFLMRYHYVLVVPFLFALLEMTDFKNLRTITEWILCLCVFALVSSYVLSANATFECFRISYRIIEKQTDRIIDDIYELPEYMPNETTIIFAGFPSDSTAREKIGIYDYAIALPSNIAYWEDWNGILSCRIQYLRNYYGIEAGDLTKEEYKTVIDSKEFDNMPLWPQKGSVDMINGAVVVKLSEMPPLKGEAP